MRKWIKILFFFFFGFILGGLLIPVLYKGKVLSLVRKELNHRVNGKIEFSDLNLSIFKKFPLITCQILDIQVLGNGVFDQTKLFEAKSLDLRFDLIKMIQARFKQFELKKIKINSPALALVTLQDGLFNLKEILKTNPDSSKSKGSTNVNLQLEAIEILEGSLQYIDSSAMTFAELKHFNHKSKGSFDQAVLSLIQSSSWDSLNVNSGGIQYMTNAVGTWNGNLRYHQDSNIISLTKDQITLNALVIELMGSLKVISSGSSAWDFMFKAPKTDLKQFVSMIPGAYKHHFAEVKTEGYFTLNGSVRGIYDSTGRKPIIQLTTEIKDGRIKYDHLPYPIDQIQLDMQVRSLDSFFNVFDIKIPRYSLAIQKNPIAGQLFIHIGSSIDVKGTLKGNMDLEDFKKAYPVDSMNMSGYSSVDAHFEFTNEQISKKKYDQLKLAGTFKTNNLMIQYPTYLEVRVESLDILLHPISTKMQIKNALYGHTDFNGTIDIDHILALASSHPELATIYIQSNSKLIDLDEISAGSGSSSIRCDTCFSMPSEEHSIVSKMQVRFNSAAQVVKYQDYTIANLTLVGNYRQDSLDLNQATLSLNSSPLNIKGRLIHPYRWSNRNQLLTGSLYIQSDNFNLNPWLSETGTASTLSKSDTIYIKHLPERTDLNIQANLKQALYGDMTFKNLALDSKLSHQNFEIYNSTGTLFNGKINLNGVFQESGTLPVYNFKLDLSKLNIGDIFKSSKMVAKLAPLASLIDGSFSSSVILEGKLSAQLEPIFEAFDASGVLETFNGLMSKFKPLEDLANKIQLPSLNFIKWEKSKNWFTIDNGTVTVNPFIIRYGEIPIQISGQHRLDQMMNYDLVLSIPKKVFEKQKIGLITSEKLEWLRKEVSAKGITISALDTVFLLLNIQGTIKQPQTSISWISDPRGKSKLDQVKDELIDAIKHKADSIKEATQTKIESTKDSLLTVIQKEIDLKKDQLDSVSNMIRDTLKKVAEKKAKQILDSIVRKETTKILDSALQSKVDTLLGTRTKEEIERINEKLKNWNPFKKKPNPTNN